MPRVCFCDTRYRTLGLLIGLCVGVNAAPAQDKPPEIPYAVRNAEKIGAEENQTMDAFVSYWTQQLVSGARGAVADAKDELTKAMEGKTSKAYMNAYGAKVAKALDEASKHDSALVRMSVMVVIAGASTGDVAALCQRGLRDPHPGVRYQAGKAAADVMERWVLPETPPFPPEQQRALLATLKEAMDKEQVGAVYTQMGRAISRLSISEGFDEAMRLLDQRIRWLHEHPEQSPDVARVMLRNLLLFLNAQQVLEQNIDARLLDLGAAAGRCLRVLLGRLERNELTDPDAQQAWGETLDVIESEVLKKVMDRLGSGATGPSFLARLRRKQWSKEELGADIVRWIGAPNSPGLLTSSANIPLTKLLFEDPAPAAPPAAPAAN